MLSLAALLGWSALVSPAAGAAQAPAPPEMVRLFGELRPSRYDIDLRIDPEKGVFSGSAVIHAEAVRELAQLRLHALELRLTRLSVDGTPVDVSRIRYDAARELLEAKLARHLMKGETTLELAWTAKLNERMKGLYRSAARAPDGKVERYAFTQFEATDFRRMVPSVDEPEARAVFHLRVSAPGGLTVLSNTRPESVTGAAGGWRTTDFRPTPPMASYLVALAAARLERRSRAVGRTTLSVQVLPWDADKAEFALREASAAFAWYEAYYGVEYSLDKLDLIAVPDFDAGAMENWGAIFFRDSAILVDPAAASVEELRRVAETVDHEIAHQWFGDLVTMRWWNDLWLNEAFATFMSYRALDALHPEWSMWHDFDEGLLHALQTDSLRRERSIAVDVRTPGQILEMFDDLTYEKAASVLRMLEGYLGPEVFRRGVHGYLERHALGNTTTKDLWDSLSEASGQDVAAIAAGWIDRPGFPGIAVAVSTGGASVELAQRRFFADGGADATLWSVPLVVSYGVDADTGTRESPVLLSSERAAFPLGGGSRVAWAYPNAGGAGFFRVLPGPQERAGLIAHLGALRALERVHLLDDLWAAARAGREPLDAFLQALEACRGEERGVVLQSMGRYVQSLGDRLVGPEDRPAFARFIASVFEPSFARLGFDAAPGDDDERRLGRAAAFSALAVYGSEDALRAEAKRRLSAYLDSPAGVDPTLAAALLPVGARLGDAALYDIYEKRMREARTPQERVRYLEALGDFRDPALARRLIELTLAQDPASREPVIRAQDLRYPYRSLLENPQTQAPAAEAVLSSWPRLHERTGDEGSVRLVESFASLWSADWSSRLLKQLGDADYAATTVARAAETMSLGARFADAQRAALSAWLRARDAAPGAVK